MLEKKNCSTVVSVISFFWTVARTAAHWNEGERYHTSAHPDMGWTPVYCTIKRKKKKRKIKRQVNYKNNGQNIKKLVKNEDF